jgi:hypothetical protein
MSNDGKNQIDESMPAPISFLFQCFAAAVLATCLIILSALITGWHHNVYALIFLLPFIILLTMPITGFIGGVLGLVRLISPKLPGRLVVGLGVAYVIGLCFESMFFPEEFLSPIEFAICFGTPTAFLVGSEIRLWRVFTFGTVNINNGRRSFRETSSNVFVLLGSLPLRLLNLSLLVVIILTGPALARDSYRAFRQEKAWFIGIAIAIFLICYLISGIYLSYRTPRSSLLMSIVTLLNAPQIGLAIWLYSKRNIEIEGPFFLAAAVVTMFYVMIWGLCLVSRIVAARLIQRKIQLEQFALLNEHHCLGERMAFWQQEWSPEFGGTK